MKVVTNKRRFGGRVTIVVTVAWLERVCCCCFLGNRRGARSRKREGIVYFLCRNVNMVR